MSFPGRHCGARILATTIADQDIIVAPGLGNYIHVQTIYVQNLSATARNITIKDGAGNTLIRFQLAIGSTAAANSRECVTFPGFGLRLPANTKLVSSLSADDGTGVEVTVTGYIDSV